MAKFDDFGIHYLYLTLSLYSHENHNKIIILQLLAVFSIKYMYLNKLSACDFGITCLRLFKYSLDMNSFSQHCNRESKFPHTVTEQIR